MHQARGAARRRVAAGEGLQLARGQRLQLLGFEDFELLVLVRKSLPAFWRWVGARHWGGNHFRKQSRSICNDFIPRLQIIVKVTRIILALQLVKEGKHCTAMVISVVNVCHNIQHSTAADTRLSAHLARQYQIQNRVSGACVAPWQGCHSRFGPAGSAVISQAAPQGTALTRCADVFTLNFSPVIFSHKRASATLKGRRDQQEATAGRSG